MDKTELRASYNNNVIILNVEIPLWNSKFVDMKR